jgi:hypothetical protein
MLANEKVTMCTTQVNCSDSRPYLFFGIVLGAAAVFQAAVVLMVAASSCMNVRRSSRCSLGSPRRSGTSAKHSTNYNGSSAHDVCRPRHTPGVSTLIGHPAGWVETGHSITTRRVIMNRDTDNDTNQDTEGHGARIHPDDKGVDDANTDGHVFRHVDEAADDAEGHANFRNNKVDDADTEGSGFRGIVAEDGDEATSDVDTEGNSYKYHP